MDCVFRGFPVSQIRLIGVAVTVKSRRRYGEMSMRLQCNGNAIWLLSQKKLAKNPPPVLPKGGRLPFFRSICTCSQVLNFGNNNLHFHAFYQNAGAVSAIANADVRKNVFIHVK